MKVKVFVLSIALCLVLIVSSSAEVTPQAVDYYGLKSIAQPYKKRIEDLIIDKAVKDLALKTSGFKVYALKSIKKVNNRKQYSWVDSSGNEITTEWFLGVGEVFLTEGAMLLGVEDILWLTVWRQGDEIKFTKKN